MTKEELIAKLEEVPGNPDVVFYGEFGYSKVAYVEFDSVWHLKSGTSRSEIVIS
jgi:hypothetical protein